MTGAGWSTPSLHGAHRSATQPPNEQISDAGDLDALMLAAGPTPLGLDQTFSWSSPVYSGPRRWRPAAAGAARPEQGVQAAQPAAGDLRTGSRQAEQAGQAEQAEQTAKAVPAEPGLLASSRTMAVASLASRVTGFVRTLALGAALGAGAHSVADAYNLANTLPNMVYELLIGGVLSSVIIPILVKAQHDDADDGIGYAQRLLSIVTVGLGITTLLAVLAAPQLIDFFGGPAPDRTVATLWASLLLPEIFFYGLGALLSAILNTRGVYGWPAWAPILNNLVTIAAVALFLLVPGPGGLNTSTITNTQILVLGIGTTVGIAAQALILLIPLRRLGFTWRWRFRPLPGENGRMAEFRTLTVWVLGYVAISQVGVVVINRIARARGAVTIFTYADLLFQVPYGIVGVSLLTALMPRMSRAAARGEHAEVLADLRLGTRLSAVVLIPVSAGLMVFGPAFASVIFEFRLHLDDARLIGTALACAAFGLLPFAVLMLQQRVFYAVRDTRTPTLINLLMVGAKVALVVTASQVLSTRNAIVALTVTTSLSYCIGAVAGHLLLTRRFGPLGFRPVAVAVSQLVGVCAVAGGAAAAVVLGIQQWLGVSRTAGLIELICGGAVGLLLLLGLGARLPLPEIRQLRSVVEQRRR